MKTFTFDNISFSYRDEGTGRPIIFLHGLGGDVNQPFSYFPQGKGVRLISLDFRGHGQTRYFGDEEKFRFHVFARDVIALMDHLDIDSVIIGGISTGAGVALHIALNYPDRVEGLILSRVAWEDRPQEEKIQEAFKEIAECVKQFGASEGKIKFQNSQLFFEFDELSPAVAESLVKQFDYPYIEETFMKLIEIPQDAPNSDREEWRKITVPTLILANKIDITHPYRYGKLLSGYIQGSIFKEIPSKSVSNKLHQDVSKELISEFLNNNF
ncbi:alpha/beta hydrolase [Peribacillus frigoritolerans]|uniref:alpha/beta fold hydrolase n=1 Tax=Peribacillus frigoritolerans TaxID=450367 RepID=UPI002E236A39|nr:alpha/beta hydrolase [Peribacillus frigoritolerans]